MPSFYVCKSSFVKVQVYNVFLGNAAVFQIFNHGKKEAGLSATADSADNLDQIAFVKALDSVNIILALVNFSPHCIYLS